MQHNVARSAHPPTIRTLTRARASGNPPAVTTPVERGDGDDADDSSSDEPSAALKSLDFLSDGSSSEEDDSAAVGPAELCQLDMQEEIITEPVPGETMATRRSWALGPAAIDRRHRPPQMMELDWRASKPLQLEIAPRRPLHMVWTPPQTDEPPQTEPEPEMDGTEEGEPPVEAAAHEGIPTASHQQAEGLRAEAQRERHRREQAAAPTAAPPRAPPHYEQPSEKIRRSEGVSTEIAHFGSSLL
jgi:hypothetical protein